MPDFLSGTEITYNPRVARADGCARVLQFVQGSQMISELLCVPSHGCRAQGAALAFWEISWQTQEVKGDLTVPDSSWSRLRCLQGKHEKKWKKADQWQNTGAKINNSVFWKCPTDEQHWLLGQKL